jgi:hypothetical protein
MRKINSWTSLFIFVSVILFKGCIATGEISFKIDNSLPQDKLSYYNDPFDNLREDLWEKSAVAPKPTQLVDLKVADISTEDGQLKIKTKAGSFSSGNLITKYLFRGDFDIQLDCHFDLLEGIYDMDQQLIFGVFDSKLQFSKSHSYVIIISKPGGQNQGHIISAYREKGKRHVGKMKNIDTFHGAFRIVRVSSAVSTFYKKEGKSRWKKMDTFRSTKNDVLCGFFLSNYIHHLRTSITARSSIIARFDNFRVNAAQKIIEEDI